MRRIKNAFTLIELLATIVILGLLALVVTPGIAKVIRNSKINTAKASIEGYVRELENASALYMTDTGSYPVDIDVLELDGKNIDKIENPDVVLNNGEIEEVKAEIDGLYCKYKKGEGTSCSEESFYSYIKNSSNFGEILKEMNSKYGIGLSCLMNNECTEEEQQSLATNESAINELMSTMDMTYYGIEREQIKSIEFTNIRPDVTGTDISVNNTIDVLLYSTLKDEMYEIKIYSEKEIMFPSDSSYMFSNLNYLDNLVLNNINTLEVTNMSYMFNMTGYSSDVFTLDLGDKFDTRNVTDMSSMFYQAAIFTLDLGDKFDTRNVTDMSWMFYMTGYSSEEFTLDLGDKFDTRNVTNMSGMFSVTGRSSEVFTLDLGDKFDTSNVTNMSNMFEGTGISSPTFNLDLGEKFDTRNVTNMSYMFRSIGYLIPQFTLDLSTFDTGKVTDMSSMFDGAESLKTIYVSNKWTTNTVIESSHMFYNCISLPNYDSSVVDKTNAHYNTGGYLTLKTN